MHAAAKAREGRRTSRAKTSRSSLHPGPGAPAPLPRPPRTALAPAHQANRTRPLLRRPANLHLAPAETRRAHATPTLPCVSMIHADKKTVNTNRRCAPTFFIQPPWLSRNTARPWQFMRRQRMESIPAGAAGRALNLELALGKRARLSVRERALATCRPPHFNVAAPAQRRRVVRRAAGGRHWGGACASCARKQGGCRRRPLAQLTQPKDEQVGAQPPAQPRRVQLRANPAHLLLAELRLGIRLLPQLLKGLAEPMLGQGPRCGDRRAGSAPLPAAGYYPHQQQDAANRQQARSQAWLWRICHGVSLPSTARPYTRSGSDAGAQGACIGQLHACGRSQDQPHRSRQIPRQMLRTKQKDSLTDA